MRNIDEALAQVICDYKPDTLRYSITQDIPDKVWIVDIHHQQAPESLLRIEVIDDDGVPKCLVLQKINVGRRSMYKFMNRLVNRLDDTV